LLRAMRWAMLVRIAFGRRCRYTGEALLDAGGSLLADRAIAQEGRARGLRFTASKSTIALSAGALAVALVGLAVAWQMSIWPLNQGSSRALARRAQYFWDLRIAGDSMAAYDYMVETYRRRVDANGFSKSSGMVVWTKAAVKDVMLDEKGGLVDVELHYRVAKPGIVDLETSNVVRDRWVLEDGEWHRWPPELGG
jgi:hypothetical protein